MPRSFPNGVIARSIPSTVTMSTVQVARSKNGSISPTAPPSFVQTADTRSPEPVSIRMFCHVSGRESAAYSCSREAPTACIAVVSAFVQRSNLSEKPIAHSRNMIYSVPQMESITSAYAIADSPMSSAACIASMFPPPPIQLPQSAPRDFQAPSPSTPRIIAKETTNPSEIENVASRNPSSIFGPSRSILRRSQRSSIMNSMAYNSGFFKLEYAAEVAWRSHAPSVQSAISPRYISTTGGAKLKNLRAAFPFISRGRYTSTAAANISTAM